MIENNKICVIIPARGGSKRLPRKNIYNVCGKPMILWGIEACRKSKYIDEIYVSSEDEEILNIAKENKINVIARPGCLASDLVYKQDAIVHAVDSLNYDPDIVISLQANSPQVRTQDLDGAIEKFIKYDRNEIFSVDADLIMNAAFRIMRYEYVFQKTLSTKSGVYITNYVDIHDKDDVDYIERNGLL